MTSIVTAEDLVHLTEQVEGIEFTETDMIPGSNCHRLHFVYVYKRETMKASINLFLVNSQVNDISFSPADDYDSVFLFRKIGRPFDKKKELIQHAVLDLLKSKGVRTSF